MIYHYRPLLSKAFWTVFILYVFLNSNFQSQYEVTELREEDIIEAVPGTTVVMTSAGAVVTNTGSTTTSSVHDAVAAAVNEAIKVRQNDSLNILSISRKISRK